MVKKMKRLKLFGVKVVLMMALVMLMPTPLQSLLTPALVLWLLYFVVAHMIIEAYMKDKNKPKDEVCRCKKTEA